MIHDQRTRRRVRRLAGGAGLVAVAALTGQAPGQLIAQHLYNFVDRPLPVTVRVPPDAAGSVQVQLFAPVAAAMIDRADVKVEGGTEAGRGGNATRGARGEVRIVTVDLVELFPQLWKAEPPRLVYAQLVVGGRKIGPALVLTPLVVSPYAARADRAGVPIFPTGSARGGAAGAKSVLSGIRAEVDREVEIETSKGTMRFALRPDAAPHTVEHFRGLVDKGFYTDMIVHRIASLQGRTLPDIVQTGDPTGTGLGGPGFMIDLENSTLPHDYGVLSMARGNDPNSAGSQFFICLSREGTASLDGRYASFGQLVSGSETLMALAATPVNQENRPIDPPRVISVKLVDAPPYGEGPRPLTDPLARKPER